MSTTGQGSAPVPLPVGERAALVLAFVASGAAALLFQILWFRQLALSLGNTVWAGSLVLASFMGGLALGNLLAARWRGGVQASLRTYALLETIVALAGVGLLVVLPRLPQALAPLLGGLDRSVLQNVARLGISSALLLVPTTAMGATLPVLMGALARRRESFGAALGGLYGWNTLGAAAGALFGEVWLIPWLGLTRTGILAAGLDLTAAAVAWSLAFRRTDPKEDDARHEPAGQPVLGPRILGLAALAGLVGCCGLALEVIWFRFLTAYVAGTSLAFALMLAVVLAGIALGGLLAAGWMSRAAGAHRWAAALGIGAALATTLSYAMFPDLRAWLRIEYTAVPLEILPLAIGLMAPTCIMSGCLFPLIGRSLREGLPTAGWAAGLLTLANTAGATIGALAGGFVLLPELGVERSIFAVSVAYAVAAVGLAATAGLPTARRGLLIPAGALCALVLALFPFGLMERVYVRGLLGRHSDMRLLQYREGLTETSMLLRGELLGQPSSHLLVTNGHPMSSTTFTAQRYMRLYVYWALAVHPQIRQAALISYGVGNTAAALVESREIESIDVVDISRDIVDLGRSIFPPDRFPLSDPRVKLHVEDGRFFLLTTRERYDLITSEPPPPRLAGVASLYTREYFALVKNALSEGGLVTYWLPMHDLDRRSAASTVRGFCEIFPDCSLWTGAGLDWMLVGGRGSRPRASEEEFGRQWRQEPSASALLSIGLDSPERLGALFQADAQDLQEFVGGTLPLSDDFPYGITGHGPTREDVAAYRDWMAPEACRRRFERSTLIGEIWPPGLRERSYPYFGEQAMYAKQQLAPGREGADFAKLARALQQTDARALPLVLVGSEPQELAIAERAAASGRHDPLVDYYLGLGALSRREFGRAADSFDRVAAAEPAFEDLVFFRALSRCLAGDGPRAAAHLAAAQQRAPDAEARLFWTTLAQGCGAAGASVERGRQDALSPRPPEDDAR